MYLLDLDHAPEEYFFHVHTLPDQEWGDHSRSMDAKMSLSEIHVLIAATEIDEKTLTRTHKFK